MSVTLLDATDARLQSSINSEGKEEEKERRKEEGGGGEVEKGEEKEENRSTQPVKTKKQKKDCKRTR